MPTALITGASTGIGAELVKLLARDGFDLVLVARSAGTLQALADSLGRPAQVIAEDLSVPGAAQRVVDALQGKPVEILINNAGFGTLGLFAESDPASQEGMLAVNIVALTMLTRLLAPGMAAAGKGRILNVASTAAFQPGPLMAVYYASKAYVLSFSGAIRNELKPRGVTVTTLCPGPTATEFQTRAGMGKTKLFAKPMSAVAVAEAGYRGMMRGKAIVIPGRMNAVGAFLTRFAPRGLAASFARRLQEAGLRGSSPA